MGQSFFFFFYFISLKNYIEFINLFVFSVFFFYLVLYACYVRLFFFPFFFILVLLFYISYYYNMIKLEYKIMPTFCFSFIIFISITDVLSVFHFFLRFKLVLTLNRIGYYFP